MKVTVSCGEKEVKFDVNRVENHEDLIEVTDFETSESVVIDLKKLEFKAFSAIIDGKSFEIYVYKREDGFSLNIEGENYFVSVSDDSIRRRKSKDASSSGEIKVPITGNIIKVAVVEGDIVKEGDLLFILEAMKLQNEVKAPFVGKVTKVNIKEGEVVEAETVAIVLEPIKGANEISSK